MPRGGDEERGQMPGPRDRCVPTLLNQPVNKTVKLRPPNTRPSFVGRQKFFTRRLVCGEFRQVCDKSGLVGRYLTVLDLKTSCRALSASVRWTKTICRGSRVPQPTGRTSTNCHVTQVKKRLFQHGGYRLGPKPKRGKGLIT